MYSTELHDDYFLDASNIEIEINEDEVILSGTVTDRNSKRRAEDIVESVSGIHHVENRIRVDQDARDSSESYLKSNENGAKT